MKRISGAALGAAVAALVLAVIALARSGGGAGHDPAKIEELAGRLRPIERDLGKLKEEVAKAARAEGDVKDQVQALGAKLSELSDRTARLDRAVAGIAERPAAKVELDDEKLREIVRARMEEMAARARGARGGVGGARVELARVSDAAKEAALKAVEGFEIDHVHDAGKTEDGKTIYSIDGRAGGRNHRVKVTAEGKVLESGPRQRRGRGRGRPPRRPEGGAPRPAAEPDGGQTF